MRHAASKNGLDGDDCRDVGCGVQQLLRDARPMVAAVENRHRGKHMSYLPMWRMQWRFGLV